MKKRLYVAMSGGVDSSVAAALLKDSYYVTGVYMKNWTADLPGFKCPWQEDFEDAKRVAVQLGINLKMYDFQKQYRKYVVDYMIREYKKGLTPNPDIICNQEIKFKLFLETALKDGADLIATGHYSQINDGSLYAAKDKNKDQSYFLYRINKQALSKCVFPLGGITKPEVRKLAQKHNLSIADKADSQGICFIGEVGIKEFLIKELGLQAKGDIITDKGEKIGHHDGAIFYTIGQRHGLNVGGGLPYYVTNKDIKKNIVFVTTDISSQKLWTKEIKITNEHWIDTPPNPQKDYQVRYRYRGPLVKAKYKLNMLSLAEDAKAVAAGQSAVIYDNEKVIGGGIISQ